MSPSLRGSGLKFGSYKGGINMYIVSLFTREWIEIADNHAYQKIVEGLPLYEGVD